MPNSIQITIYDSGTKGAKRFKDVRGIDLNSLRVLFSRDYIVTIVDDGAEGGIGLIKQAADGEYMKLTKESFVNGYTTATNPYGLGVLGDRFLAIPGISKGKVQLVDLKSMKSNILNAHTTDLRAIALSTDEELIATASTRGTLVRVFSTNSGAKVSEYRRGMEEADVFALAFSPDNTLLALTSDRGTLHLFELLKPDFVDSAAEAKSDNRSRPDHQRRISDTSTIRSSLPSKARPRSMSSKQVDAAHFSSKGSPKMGSSPSDRGFAKVTARDISPSPDDSVSQIDSHRPTRPDTSLQPGSSSKAVRYQDSKLSRRDMSPGPDDSVSQVDAYSHRSSRPDLPLRQGASSKTTRFQDPAPPSPSSRFSGSPSYDAYGPNYADYVPATHQQPPPSSALKSTSFRNTLANLPFAPSSLQIPTSVAKIRFHLPSIHSTHKYTTLDPAPSIPPPITPSSTASPASSIPSSINASHASLDSRGRSKGSTTTTAAASHIIPAAPQGKPLPKASATRLTLADGAPPKGQMAWVGETELVVVSAGRGGRWEKFTVQRDGSTGQVAVGFVGWKPYAVRDD